MADPTDDTGREMILRKKKELALKRAELAEKDGPRAMEAILSDPQPAALVHSMPEEDLYFLISDIGPADALPLLTLASDRQISHILDREIWDADQIDHARLLNWMMLLFQADPGRITDRFLEDHKEIVQFLFYRHLDLCLRETDQDLPDVPDEYFSFDETMYVRVISPPESEEGPGTEEKEAFFYRFLKTLAFQDYHRFFALLMESPWIIPAELQEEAYRLRNVRLAEKGFLPFEQAVGVYQPLAPDKVAAMADKSFGKPDDSAPSPSGPVFAAGLLKPDNQFVREMALLKEDHLFEELQGELASLINEVASADKLPVKSKDQLREVVKKVCGYLSAGLQAVSEASKTAGPAAELIRRRRLKDIFRAGYGLALNLKWRAVQWRKSSWYESAGLGLQFWDEDGMGVLGGLFIPRPLFFDNYATGRLYREFASFNDMEKIRAALEDIIFVDRLFFSMKIQDPDRSLSFLTWKNLMLTLWARDRLGLAGPDLSIPLEKFRPFFGKFFEKAEQGVQAAPALRDDFILWLSEKTGFPEDQLRHEGRRILESMFRELAAELGPVDPAHLDPRFIRLFFLKP